MFSDQEYFDRDEGPSAMEMLTQQMQQLQAAIERKKERKNSLTRGHVEDIGSAAGIQSYVSGGTKGWCPGMCNDNIPVPLCLRDGGALRGSSRASPVCVCVAASC